MFEAARTLGGRSRRVDAYGTPVDNGAHILLGAYSQTLELLRTVHGAGAERELSRPSPPRHRTTRRVSLAYPGLPAPWHLASALLTMRGVSWRDRLRTARFARALARSRFWCPPQLTVAALLAEQPKAAVDCLWEPLCIAALNTPIDDRVGAGVSQRHAARLCSERARFRPAAAARRPVDAVSRRRGGVSSPIAVEGFAPASTVGERVRHEGRGRRHHGLYGRAIRGRRRGGRTASTRTVAGGQCRRHARWRRHWRRWRHSASNRLRPPISSIRRRWDSPPRCLSWMAAPGQWLFNRELLDGPAGLACGRHQHRGVWRQDRARNTRRRDRCPVAPLDARSSPPQSGRR